jgi:hypothetical protein
MGMTLGGLLIILNEPLAKLLHMFYHKLVGFQSTKEKLQRTKLIFIINGTIVMIMYAWNLHNVLAAPIPGD